MPTRYIKESARTSKNLSNVKNFSERLFWRLITTADDFGRFMSCHDIVRASCFPLVRQVTVMQVKSALLDLQNNQLIQLYTVGDRDYGVFVNWERHQGAPRAKTSKYPDPPTTSVSLPASAHICMQPPADSLGAPDTDTDTDTIPNTDLSSLSSPNPKIHLLSKTDAEFQDVWAAYPRKVGKQAAQKAWMKLGEERPAVSLILDAIARQRTWPDWTKDDGQYIPHLATWLNQHRWDDERMVPLPKPRRKPTSLVELL